MLKNLLCVLSFMGYIGVNQAYSSDHLTEEKSELIPCHRTQQIGFLTLSRYHYDTVHSTQEAAKKHHADLRQDHWNLTTADTLTNDFRYDDGYSVVPKGSLFGTFSLPFSPKLMSRFSLLGPTIALAVADTLRGLGVKEGSIGFQWVHTVFVWDKRIARSLIEGNGSALTISISLKVEAGDDRSLPMTSLEEVLGEMPSREYILGKLSYCVVHKLNRFLNEFYNPIADYRLKLLGRGQKIVIWDGGERKTGVFQGINDQGFLLLRQKGESMIVPTGTILRFFEDNSTPWKSSF